jgi:hypothetical protein
MRKLWIIGLVFSLCLTAIGFADKGSDEPFELNGIRFGMSIDEVLRAEKGKLRSVTNDITTNGTFLLCYDGDDDDEYSYLWYGFKDNKLIWIGVNYPYVSLSELNASITYLSAYYFANNGIESKRYEKKKKIHWKWMFSEFTIELFAEKKSKNKYNFYISYNKKK